MSDIFPRADDELPAGLVNFEEMAFTLAFWADALDKVARRWTDVEFAGLNLGDTRLNKRARTLMDTFAARPAASIPEACDSCSATCAAYRFLSNPDVTWEGILAPHWSCTQERMREQAVVLCIQDTTELDFNGQEIAGLGPLNYEARRGMYLHPTYAVTPEREPLGMLDAWMWSREQRGSDGGQAMEKGADVGPTVCSCFGVGRNTICNAIREHGLTSAAQITACVKAGGNCGSCVPELKQLLAETLAEAGV